jgi:hypothetical protein
MDLQSSGDSTGRWKPIKMICVFLLAVLLHGKPESLPLAFPAQLLR